MRKWQNLAPPDDPGSWFDVDGVWPTNRGSYESADFLTGTAYTATGCGDVVTAWRANTTSTSVIRPRFIVDDSPKIWRYDSVAADLVDRTGTAAFGNLVRAEFAQFGNVSIGVLGSTRSASVTGGATVFTASPGTNFAALAGAPPGESICVQSNAVLIFNTTDKDGWAASDVGDYTNWTTNEAASGRIYEPAGPIYSAVSFAGSVYAFKSTSIHRLRYVGDRIKWVVEKVWDGVGCGFNYNVACAGASGILFAGYSKTDAGTSTTPMYWYDGVNPPVLTNPLTQIPGVSAIAYHPQRDIFSVWVDSAVYYFAPKDMAWGKSASPLGASPGTSRAYKGEVLSIDGDSVTTSCWAKSAANTLKLYSVASNVGTSYLETAKLGSSDMKTGGTRATPQLRRLVDSGTESASLSVSFFRERYDTSAQRTITASKSADRHRFDFTGVDNFMRLKLTYTDYDFEIDDLPLSAISAGKD